MESYHRTQKDRQANLNYLERDLTHDDHTRSGWAAGASLYSHDDYQDVCDFEKCIRLGLVGNVESFRRVCTEGKERREERSVPNNIVQENEMLQHKVLKIEMENIAQQKRLQQLEKMVMELAYNRSPTHVLDMNHHPPFGESRGINKVMEGEGVVSKNGDFSSRRTYEESEHCYTSDDERLSGDVASLMEEFDRKGRENGLVYGRSVADSDELDDVTCRESLSMNGSSKSTIHSEDVSSSPLPAFLTPSYHHSLSSNINPYSSENEPMISPQLCLTTPVLLTAAALREAEKHQGLVVKNETTNRFSCLSRISKGSDLPISSSFLDKSVNKPALTITLGSKVSPFSNLLAGIHQASNKGRTKSNNPGKSYWPGCEERSEAPHTPPAAKDSGGFLSPGSSVSGRVCKWSRSLRLPLLSPFPDSHCSDLDTHASDEEDLVVDEVVSLSMAGGNRQRSESFCSITGPCVPPDLLLDTRKIQDEEGVSLGEVREEDIMTEIAGELEDSMLLEDSPELIEDVMTPALHTQADVVDDTVKSTMKDEVKHRVKQEPQSGTEASMCETEHEEIESQVVNKKTLQGSRTLQIDGKDVKLPAGSIILAMVNESGSLVPLPQLPVPAQSLTRTVKVETHDEEIDIETVAEETPVLEAGDLDSLLAQFEASEAVNKSGNNNTKAVSKSSKQLKSVGLTSSVAGNRRSSGSGISSSSNLPQASPTHQNIKDALPKEIIEKIKASTKRKSTQMLPEPLVVRKGRGVKQQEVNPHRSKAHRVVSQSTTPQNTTDLRVPPPLDHDYCISSEKSKKNKHSESRAASNEGLFNKLPDYYTTIPRHDAKKQSISSDEGNDDGGKKDSGVESGDVSDASVETEERRKDGKDSRAVTRDWRNKENRDEGAGYNKDSNIDIYNKLPAYMTDIGNSKPKDDVEADGNGSDGEKEEEKMVEDKPEAKKIKRKLNLSEYRQRIQSTQSSRCPSPALTDTSQAPSGVTSLQVSELVGKMESAKTENLEKKQLDKPESDSSRHVAQDEEMEEGELKGDSESETPVKPHSGGTTTTGCLDNSTSAKLPKDLEAKSPEKSLSVLSLSYNSCSAGNFDGCWKSGSHGPSSRRWSSSSRSRSRSKSPVIIKKHSSRKHRSSRGKRRRTHRCSRSSQSPHSSSRRRWSRSRSRSRSKGRSCSSSSCSSTRSSSRSRSRSNSVKTRDRWVYSHRLASRERRRRSHSRSRSLSSSRYSRVTRSRSPVWGPNRQSRSPHHRLPLRPRRPEDEDRTRQVEERRVIYIGRISEGTTKGDLRRRFQKFGDIVDISVHFREHGDNYGFVTYKNRDEAYNAVEHGNDDPSVPRYDLCFGGRRAFCKVQYSDLDAQANNSQYVGAAVGVPVPARPPPSDSMDFDSLLRAAMKRKTR
ncbi:uncharacterized protein LOC121862250 isoform X2 [Homarus americanus]|uniref:uncharacterized protein LOC121862250 isoform X2 n=1 Tax=Homarus americanus TaxID=6706 RepID=UPI001C48D6B8|nr:uncharacterized protein LOC121862250 isoform X2 [Homarus americanus]